MELRSKILSLLYPLKRYLDKLFTENSKIITPTALPLETYTQ